MRRFLLVCLFLLIPGCSSIPAAPHGEILFYVRITEVSFCAPIRRDTGLFFYREGTPGNPIVSVYEMRDGRAVHFSRSSSEEAFSLLRDLADLDFVPFDFDAEASLTTQKVEAEAKAAGKDYTVILGTDGVEYEIRYNSPRGSFVMREFNPGMTIKYLGNHSEKIRKLDRLIGRFAEHYGRSEFGL